MPFVPAAFDSKTGSFLADFQVAAAEFAIEGATAAAAAGTVKATVVLNKDIADIADGSGEHCKSPHTDSHPTQQPMLTATATLQVHMKRHGEPDQQTTAFHCLSLWFHPAARAAFIASFEADMASALGVTRR